jgi:rhodanese-related sulfurtransferase/DNA-binding transcriptional ArsR family regulator
MLQAAGLVDGPKNAGSHGENKDAQDAGGLSFVFARAYDHRVVSIRRITQPCLRRSPGDAAIGAHDQGPVTIVPATPDSVNSNGFGRRLLTELIKYSIEYLMSQDPAHRAFKDRLYGQFARVGKAIASPHRLELLELLAQGERTVDDVAGEVGMSTANASQHLQALREAGLVDNRKQGLFVHYRLADESVFELSTAIRTVAERRLADLDRIVRDHFGDRSHPEPVAMNDLLARARSGKVVILDTRPPREFAAGHIAGAVSVPVDDLKRRLAELPKTKEFVAYCRGPYCVYADRAVELLRASGRKARRLVAGFPEWKAAGLPVERAPQMGAA